MNKPDWFKFYPEKWLASKTVRRMSLPARAVYFDLLCEAWHQTPPGSLPDDDASIADLAGVKPSVWARVGTEVRKAFKAGDDGRIYQAFMAGPVASAAYGKSERARAAAKARWDADAMQTHSECNADAMRTQCHQERETEQESESEGETEQRESSGGAGGARARGEVQERGAETPTLTPEQIARYRLIARKPDWMPSDRPWIDRVKARDLACLTTTTPALIVAAVSEARQKRNTLSNPAGLVVKRLEDPDPGLLASLSGANNP